MAYRNPQRSNIRRHRGERNGAGEGARQDLYTQVTSRIIAELEAGRLPWVQPWDSPKASAGLPRNATTARAYSGINVLILWATVIERNFTTQAWLTYRQCEALGGHVRKGEQGTTVCYADRFTPQSERERVAETGDEARRIAFLKRFTIFNIDQCEGLPDALAGVREPLPSRDIIPHADALIQATGADFRIGGNRAFYCPSADFIAVPPQQAYRHQIDWYRTAYHELGHYAARRFMQCGCRKRLHSGLSPRGMRHNLGASRTLAQPANGGYGCAHGNQTADEEALRGTGGPGVAGEA